MKLEAGNTYVFKDDAARDKYLTNDCMNGVNVDSHYKNGFTLTYTDSDDVCGYIGDAWVIGYSEIDLFEEYKEPFDISEYEFSDSIGVGTVQPDQKGDLVVNLNKGSWIHMDKLDAEAIAKHFKLI